MTDYTPAFKPELFKILGCTLSIQAPDGSEFAVVAKTGASAPRLKQERDELLEMVTTLQNGFFASLLSAASAATGDSVAVPVDIIEMNESAISELIERIDRDRHTDAFI